jgi:hypothetical protein
LFRCSFAFANSDFSTAIFVKCSLNFWSTSAISPLRKIVPFNALVRSDAAFMTCFGCDLWVCDILVFEEHRVTDSCHPGFHDVDVETLVMLNCRSDVETGICVNIPMIVCSWV